MFYNYFEVIRSFSSPQLDVLMLLLSYSYIIVLPILFYSFFKKKKWKEFLALILFSYLFSITLKHLFKEERPCKEITTTLYCENSYSFPSDHAIVLSSPLLILKKKKVYFVWLMFVLFSRVYLMQHYIHDVLAGFIMGICISYFAKRFF
ncbi:MAG: phosphatase PAP2 family protein [Candidatus Micrarchaeales archaeon]